MSIFRHRKLFIHLKDTRIKMKSPISILTWLCLLFLASCISNKKTSLEAFKQDVYTPEYATGFKIMGADNTASTLIQVSNPWQGAKDVKMYYFISRNGKQACRIYRSYDSCRSQTHRMFGFFLHRHVRRIRTSGQNYRSIGHRLCIQSIYPCTQRFY